MKKRFGFSLDEDLHAALQARAEQEGSSMAAICREALLLHLQRPALELPLFDRPDTQDPLWRGLKRQVRDYLGETSYQEYRPEHTPDVFVPEEDLFYAPAYDHWVEPKRKAPREERSSPPRQSYHSGRYNSRYLDELWA